MDKVIYEGDIIGNTNISVFFDTSDDPKIVVKATINLPFGPPIERYMLAEFAATSTRGLFAYGVLMKKFIHIPHGRIIFDSWNSDPDSNPATPFVPYSRSVARDNARIATAGTGEGDIDIGISQVYGTAAVGSNSFKGLKVSWSGQVGPKDPNEWDPSDKSALWMKDPPGWKVSTKTEALTTGFTATFEEITAPSEAPTEPRWTIEPLTTSGKSGAGHAAKVTIGSPGQATRLELGELILAGNARLTIQGDVTIHLPVENKKSLEIRDNARIEMTDDATLTIYTAGDVSVKGGSTFNETAAPKDLQIWGTAKESQEIEFRDFGKFSGIVYAPNANITIKGGSSLYGAVVGKSAILKDSGSVHYDESLTDFDGGGGGGPASVSYVEELVGEERESYLSLLDF